MKKMICILSLLFLVSASGQGIEQEKSGFVAGADIRMVGDKAVDFSKAIIWARDYLTYCDARYAATSVSKQMEEKGQAFDRQKQEFKPIELFIHKVTSVGKDGLLCEDGDRFVFLKNFPVQVVDGDMITCLAVPAGIYQYKNALGGLRTVRCYDFGVPQK